MIENTSAAAAERFVSEQGQDDRRRRFLVAGTAIAGGAAFIGVAYPFVASMMPSERARAGGAPVEVDIGKIDPGGLMTVAWRGKPVWILRRSETMLDLLGRQDDKLRDPRSDRAQQPGYCKNPTRSIKPEYFVAVGVCTHLGCTPSYRPEAGPVDLGADWSGGFFCPCHGSRFDLAGRVFKNVPAPLNLEIPRHAYVAETRIWIGEDQKET